MTDTGSLDKFPGNSAPFKFKQKLTGVTEANVTKNVEIMVPLKYLSKFWRTLEMQLINCEIYLILTWPVNCVTTNVLANLATNISNN